MKICCGCCGVLWNTWSFLGFCHLKVTSCLPRMLKAFGARGGFLPLCIPPPAFHGSFGDPIHCSVCSVGQPGQGQLRVRLFVGTGDVCQAITLTQSSAGSFLWEFCAGAAAALAAPVPGLAVPAFPQCPGQAAPCHLFVLVLLQTKYLSLSPQAGAELSSATQRHSPRWRLGTAGSVWPVTRTIFAVFAECWWQWLCAGASQGCCCHL